MSEHPDLTRTLPIDDLEVVRAEGGDGRELVAYAAVFNTPAEIHDHDGHYWETINRTAFDRTIAQRGKRFQVLFNHGKDIWGMPSERYSMPLGTPTEVTPDARGLLTRTRISKTELGDEVLELAKDGAITGFSFRARALQTVDHGAGSDGIRNLERTEFALREYGPGVFIAYEDAEILAVRTNHLLNRLTDAEREQLRQALDDTASAPSSPPPDPAATGDSAPQPDPWLIDAKRAIRQFDLKEIPK